VFVVNLHKILVPVDFSSPAGPAIRYALSLAARFQARVTALHVLPPLQFDFAMTQPRTKRIDSLNAVRSANARRALNSFVGDAPSRVEIEREVVLGDAAETIISIANERGFDAIVMPTRGSGPVMRWLLVGSVTSKVLHGAECPVITGVHFGTYHPPLSARRILCAIDLGPRSSHVVCWSWQLAQHFRAELAVAHAAPTPGSAQADFFDETWRSALTLRLREHVETLQTNLRLEPRTYIELGDPPVVISGLARKLSADLVVLGRGASSDLAGRLRADAFDIIRLSPCPVVSV
jgi:nucleotide-binding universal stress UspA family protein